MSVGRIFANLSEMSLPLAWELNTQCGDSEVITQDGYWASAEGLSKRPMSLLSFGNLSRAIILNFGLK